MNILRFYMLRVFFCVTVFAFNVFAQEQVVHVAPSQPSMPPPVLQANEGGLLIWYILAAPLVLTLGIVIGLWYQFRMSGGVLKGAHTVGDKLLQTADYVRTLRKGNRAGVDKLHGDSLDPGRRLDQLKKIAVSPIRRTEVNKEREKKGDEKDHKYVTSKNLPCTFKGLNKESLKPAGEAASNLTNGGKKPLRKFMNARFEATGNLKNGRGKFRGKQFEKLPIRKFERPNEITEFEKFHKFMGLNEVKEFKQLPLSSDEGLISAIEQTQDEYEEDVELREIAVKILAKFKTRNSIKALSQIALYDLSMQLRLKAVLTLADFDHESIFETVLLACTDPRKEVSAVASNALSKLTFDRSEAWTKIAECEDDFRMIRSARASIESGLVVKSIDRMIYDEDEVCAYETFALLALLVKAGKTKALFELTKNYKDARVKLMILHVLKVLSDEKTLSGINSSVDQNSPSEGLNNAVVETACV